jgi:hypothetical protein
VIKDSVNAIVRAMHRVRKVAGMPALAEFVGEYRFREQLLAVGIGRVREGAG